MDFEHKLRCEYVDYWVHVGDAEYVAVVSRINGSIVEQCPAPDD